MRKADRRAEAAEEYDLSETWSGGVVGRLDQAIGEPDVGRCAPESHSHGCDLSNTR